MENSEQIAKSRTRSRTVSHQDTFQSVYRLQESARASVWKTCRDARPAVDLTLRDHTVRGRLIGPQDDAPLIQLDGPLLGEELSCTGRFSLYDVPFLFRGELRQTRAGWLLEHAQLFTQDRRLTSRVAVPSNSARLGWATLENGEPRWVESEVANLTPAGALLDSSPPAPEPPRAPFPAQLSVAGRSITCMAEVRNQVTVSGSRFTGLRLHISHEQRAVLNAYAKRRFPRLVPRRTVEANQVTSLMRDSGYLRLREGEGPSNAWHRLNTPASKDVVYRAKDGQVIGHISASRVYRRTWMMHQLAAKTGHAESGLCRRTLYELVGSWPSLIDGEQAGVLAYFDRTSRWHGRFFEGFIPWLGDEALAVISFFDRFERSADAAAHPPGQIANPAVEVGGLDPAHRVHATALVRAQLPTLTANQFDIHPDRLRTSRLAPGLARAREVFILRVDGSVRGVALCETGNRHASLFNLMNAAQLYFCLGASAPSVDEQLALLATVRRFYADSGIDNPIVMSPAGTSKLGLAEDTILAEAMGCISVGGAGLRQWENFCKLHMGQLYLRKRRELQQDETR